LDFHVLEGVNEPHVKQHFNDWTLKKRMKKIHILPWGGEVAYEIN
jgi:hypothetical protein